jgi:hypothetical protein
MKGRGHVLKGHCTIGNLSGIRYIRTCISTSCIMARGMSEGFGSVYYC